jgi:hypothetical protein
MRFENRGRGIIGKLKSSGSEVATDDNGTSRGVKKAKHIGMIFITKTNERTSGQRNF